MKKFIVGLMIFALLGTQLAFASDNNTTPGGINVNVNELTDTAKLLIQNLSTGNIAAATATFDATMKAQASDDKIKSYWDAIIAQCGNFGGIQDAKYTTVQGYDVVYVSLKFEKMNVDATIAFDTDKQVAGLGFAPSKQQTTDPAAKEVKAPEGITEKEVTVGTGEWALPGTLSVPKGKGPFPVVILVHGSGPSDRDETIGPNKPFRDIAWGLASKGVAVLRYDKRTKVYGQKMVGMSITVKQETIDDALAAVTLMQKTNGIDKNRIYVLGHSLGGMLIPRIALNAKGTAGFIVMAGPTRPLEDIMLEQYQYILSLDKTMDQSNKDATINSIKTQVNNIKKLQKNSKLVEKDLLGVPASYWLDLKSYNPAITAKKITKPMLIMQGERDYQVSLEDLNIWKTNLSSNKGVTFKTYKDLNHLFMTGKGKSTPAEYNVEGHVSQSVIDDIFNWIKK